MSTATKTKRALTAEHRPAVRRRRFDGDDIVAGDLFSGFGGLTRGMEAAGITTILAANHNRYKVEVHEANHPDAEHWVCDLADPESGDYHSPRDLPKVDWLAAGISCVHHSGSNAKRAYAEALSLFTFDDPEYEARVTRSERDRATAVCFPAGTVVVARRGLLPIEQLVVGDEVQTHLGRWRPVTAVMSHRSTTVVVRGRGHTALEVTPDHPFLTRAATKTSRGWSFGDDEGWTVAADLVGRAWQSPTQVPEAVVPSAPTGWQYDRDFWWTVGRWLGDGWINHLTPSGEQVQICCGHEERHELDGRWNASAMHRRTTVVYTLRRSGDFARWLVEHFGERAEGKRLPTWAYSLDAETRKALIEGYMSADGCSSLDGRRGSCATVSRQLAIGLKLMLQTLGWRPTLRCRAAGTWKIEGRSGPTRATWILQWMHEMRRTSTMQTIADRTVGVVTSVAEGRSDVEVFDITVDEDHSFVADGIIVHNCVLQYAEVHRPKIILVECTTELTCWGRALPGKPKIGDGTTYRWWLREMCKLGYRTKSLYLNSMFFEVPQSRDRIYICFWSDKLRDPDLEHRPIAWCEKCDEVVEGAWTWRTGIPPSGRVRWGEQYHYTCPKCSGVVVPPRAPAIQGLDLTDLGRRIGDRERPLAESTMSRIRRCIERFKEFPAVLMPAKALRGVDRHPWIPMGTQTSQQETGLLSTGALQTVAGNTFEHPGSNGCRTRHFGEPLPTQHATNSLGLLTPPAAAIIPYRSGTNPTMAHEPMPTQASHECMGLLSAGVIPYRQHTVPTTHAEPMPSFTADQIPGVVTAGVINNNGAAGEAKYRAHPVTDPFTGFTSSPTHALLAAGFFKQNGGANDTAAHPVSDPFGTLTSVDTTGLAIADWYQMLDGLEPEDCYYRMMLPHEVRDGSGFERTFIVWGSARDQIDGYGNAVSPPVGTWISLRLKDIL